MKTIIQKLTAFCCAAGILCTALAVPAAAAEKKKDTIIFPSGKPFAAWEKVEQTWQQDAMENDTEQKGGAHATAIFYGDQVLRTDWEGYANVDADIPADENTVFEWGSITKTMTWVSVMQLWEQGKIDLNADVRTYLPADFFQHLSYDDPITMLNLMNHNAGFCEQTAPLFVSDEADILPLKEALQASEPAQVHRPGEVTSYSNWTAALAGYLVECISGETFSDYVRAHIFAPLGMTHTAIAPDYSDNPWVKEQRGKMECYKSDALGVLVESKGDCIGYISLYPAGSATGTIQDLVTYGQAFVTESCPLFEKQETFNELLSPSACYGDTDIPSVCHGFFPTDGCAVRIYGHDGGTIGFSSNLWFDPESKFGFVTMSAMHSPGIEMEGDGLFQFIFGDANMQDIIDKDAPKPEIKKGSYLWSRQNHAGLLRYMPYMKAVDSADIEHFDRISDNVILADGMIVEEKMLPDGRACYHLDSMDLVEETHFELKIGLFVAFVVSAVASVFLLRIKRIRKQHNRPETYTGVRIISAAQIAKIVSFLIVLILPTVASKLYGLPKPLLVTVGIAQMICLALCILAALTSAVTMFAGKQKRTHSYQYWLNIAGNALTVAAMVFFQMYRFWGI